VVIYVHTLVLTTISLHTLIEMRRFTNDNMVTPKFKNIIN